jgi:hypothetical protein
LSRGSRAPTNVVNAPPPERPKFLLAGLAQEWTRERVTTETYIPIVL